jgi:60 kDa SS-A/Ro ribonucleoprotein
MIGTRITPQSQPADSRQVQNHAGGYSFQAPKLARLHRFLTLGTEGGTYYVREPELTKKAAGLVVQMASDGDPALVDEIVAVSTAGRAPRNNPALFALAAQCGLGPADARARALTALPKVARTGTHLLTWAGYAEQFRGWGPAMCKAVGRWYNDKELSEVAYQCLKYKQRGGWSQRDLLRLCHFGRTGLALDRKLLYDWLMGKDIPLPELPLVQAVAQAHRASGSREWVRLIGENRSLSWEMLPSEALADADVWSALINSGLPLGALLRNLGRLTSLGVLKPMGTETGTVVARLADPENLRKARIHPVNVLVALRTYASGHGARGTGSWSPVTAVCDALDTAFYRSFATMEPSGKRTVLGVDVSGSMTQPISGLPLTCSEAAAALSLVTAATEPHTAVMGFCHQFTPLDISPKMRLDDVISKTSRLSFGGTDCSLPMRWALRNGIQADHFSVYTDNETWAGAMHPHQALDLYRRETGIPARLSVIGMTATDFTIADPDDPGSLDVAGFDSAVPKMLADFARGDI